MFIFRKIKYVILSLVAFVVIGVGAGVSYWVYAQGFNKEINSESNIDNIYENYTFGKESITDKYDIYFFPSTYYLYRYANSEKDVNGKVAVPTDKPENIYGYLEYNNETKKIVKVEGDASATNGIQAGNQYHIDINGLTNEYAFSDLDKFENDTDEDYRGGSTTYRETKGTYLSIDYNNDSNGNKANYSSYIQLADAKTDIYFTLVGGSQTKKKRVINVNYEGSENDRIDGGLGNKQNDEDDFSDVSVVQKDNKNLPEVDENGNRVGNLLTSKNIYEKYSKLEIPDPFYQVLEIDDRLGYWPQLDVADGRYLPIKLSFDSYIDYNLINTYIGDPKTDMGDSNGWFTSKFSGWISVTSNQRENYKDFLPIDGFEYKDQDNLFDFMSNLKQYAELDKTTGRYVIRLFPTFSNGKNYNAVQNTSDKKPEEGYRDGIRLDYFNVYASENNDETLSMETRFFSFKGKTNYKCTVDGNSLTLNYASINNFSFSENTKAIELRGTKIRDNTWIQVTETNGGITHKGKDWLDFRNGNSNDSGALGEDITLDTKGTTKIIDLLSKNQLYNIYAVTCQRDINISNNQYYYTYQRDALNDLKDALYAKEDNQLTNKLKTGDDFPIKDLEGKQLYNLGTYVIGGNYVYGVYTILYEKVADLRLVQDISIVESTDDEGNTIYTEDTNNPINEYVANEVSNSRGLAMNTDNLYTGTISTNSSNQNVINNVSYISENNPYIYRIDGVDFRFSNTLTFAITANGKMNNQMGFNISPLGDDNSGGKKGLISVSNTETITDNKVLSDDEIIFTNADDFVDLCETETAEKDENGNQIKYNILKLKPLNDKDNAKGYYSFIFEFDSSTQKFNVYCYRFKNIFVKVFDQKPNTYEVGTEDNYGFLNHSEGEYFTCEYYAGNSIDTTNDLYTPTNSTEVTNPQNLEYIFKYYVEKRLNSNSTDSEYKDPVDSNGYSAYYLVDSVSERVLGVAKCTTNSDSQSTIISSVEFAKDLSLSKNYVFYVVSETYYENNMLKNSLNI